MSNVSKYSKISQKKIPKRKRTIREDGVREEDGKWYRCWNCGFVNNIDREQLVQRENITYELHILNKPTNINGLASNTSSNTGHTVLVESGSYEKHNFSQTQGSGCAFCGANYR